MTTEQMHVIAKITDARTFERQLEQTVEEAAEFIQAAQKIKRYPGNSLQMNHLVEETGDWSKSGFTLSEMATVMH